ncbi:MAG: hypothetical protein LBI48_02005 [Burkholderiaceae bacterium]|jgi:hypothetical protein|nr:hypothetical protein [Burkholderiaceae bacterium]
MSALDSAALQALRLIEQRLADERNCRVRALEMALELARLKGGSTDELIADAERLLLFLQIPAPLPLEKLIAAVEKAL